MTGAAAQPEQQPPTLAQIVAALSVTYSNEGVLIWLLAGNRGLENDESPMAFVRDGRMAEVAEAVRRIGDADPADFADAERDAAVARANARAVRAERELAELRERIAVEIEAHGSTRGTIPVYAAARIARGSAGSAAGEPT